MISNESNDFRTYVVNLDTVNTYNTNNLQQRNIYYLYIYLYIYISPWKSVLYTKKRKKENIVFISSDSFTKALPLKCGITYSSWAQ